MGVEPTDCGQHGSQPSTRGPAIPARADARAAAHFDGSPTFARCAHTRADATAAHAHKRGPTFANTDPGNHWAGAADGYTCLSAQAHGPSHFDTYPNPYADAHRYTRGKCQSDLCRVRR